MTKKLLGKNAINHLCALLDLDPHLVRELMIKIDIKGVATIDVTRLIDSDIFSSAISDQESQD